MDLNRLMAKMGSLRRGIFAIYFLNSCTSFARAVLGAPPALLLLLEDVAGFEGAEVSEIPPNGFVVAGAEGIAKLGFADRLAGDEAVRLTFANKPPPVAGAADPAPKLGTLFEDDCGLISRGGARL